MNQVVFCIQPSVRAAYQAQKDDVGTSLVSVYNKLNGLDTHTAAELVRYSAREFAPLIAEMDGSALLGLRATGQNRHGNCLEASEHRIKELRGAERRALPGKSLVVYEPTVGWSAMSCHVKTSCSGALDVRGACADVESVICGLKTAIFVPERISVQSTTEAPSSSPANIKDCPLRF